MPTIEIGAEGKTWEDAALACLGEMMDDIQQSPSNNIVVRAELGMTPEPTDRPHWFAAFKTMQRAPIEMSLKDYFEGGLNNVALYAVIHDPTPHPTRVRLIEEFKSQFVRALCGKSFKSDVKSIRTMIADLAKMSAGAAAVSFRVPYNLLVLTALTILALIMKIGLKTFCQLYS
jgi:hypothetical protein